MSKGDKPRPGDTKAFRENHERIFRKNDNETINTHPDDKRKRKPSLKPTIKNRVSDYEMWDESD